MFGLILVLGSLCLIDCDLVLVVIVFGLVLIGGCWSICFCLGWR